MKAGDRVVTSGLTGAFPRGLAIGGLTQVEKSEGDLFQSAEIEPEVDLSKLDEVLIITAPYEDPDAAQKLLQEIHATMKFLLYLLLVLLLVPLQTTLLHMSACGHRISAWWPPVSSAF